MVDGHAVENPITVFADSVAGTVSCSSHPWWPSSPWRPWRWRACVLSRFIAAKVKDVCACLFGRPERTLQNPALADFAHRLLMAVSIYFFDVHGLRFRPDSFPRSLSLNLTVVVLVGRTAMPDPPYRFPCTPRSFTAPWLNRNAGVDGEKALYGGSGMILLGVLAWHAYGRRNVCTTDPTQRFLGRANHMRR